MRRRRGQLSVAAVAAVLGLLVVGQLRSGSTAPGLAGLSSQELTVLVANLNTRNDQLRLEVGSLERQLAELDAARARGESAVDQLRAELARIRTWTGLVAVGGPGIRVSVRGPISADAVRDLLNELRNAGAEAIAIDGIRIVAPSVVAGPPGELSVEDVALGDPFEVVAIGSPQTLTGSLTRVGGVVAQIAATEPDTSLTVTPLERVELPATERDLAPAHARPRL